MNGIGIDWLAVAVLGGAWIFSTFKTVPLKVRNGVFALACFGIAGYRLAMGAQGPQLLFVAIAAIIGAQYAWRAFKS